MMVIDLSVVAVLLVLLRSRGWMLTVLFSLVIAGGGFGTFATSAKYHDVIIDPLGWRGHRFELIDRIQCDGSLQTGRWVTVFVVPGCNNCQQFLRDFDSLSEMSSGSRANILVVPLVQFDAAMVASLVARGCQTGSLDRSVRLVGSPPIVVVTADGVVTDVAEGSDAATLAARR